MSPARPRSTHLALASLLATLIALALALAIPAAASADFELTFDIEGNGAGTFECEVDESTPEACESGDEFPAGAELAIYAEPEEGSVFVDFSGPCGPAVCELEMNEDQIVTATFELEEFELRVETEGEGEGLVECQINKGTWELCPESELYPYETEVTLYAENEEGSEFVEWGGDECFGIEVECELTMNEEHEVIAFFEHEEFELTVWTNGEGEGFVECEVDGGFIEPCWISEIYPYGTEVRLYAEPEEGSEFVEWTGCDNVVGNECEVEMTEEKTVEAFFKFKAEEFELEVSVTGEGKVDANSGAIVNCREGSGVCSDEYVENTEVTLTATPDLGNEFVEWTGCDNVVGNECEVEMTEERTVEAIFEGGPLTEFELEVSVTGEGKVDANSGAIVNCREGSGVCSDEYVENTEVTLTATPDLGNEFVEWTGCDSEPGGNCKVKMDEPKSVTAEFAPMPPPEEFELEVTVTGEGKVSANSGAIVNCREGSGVCSDEYVENTEVTLTATPDLGNEFVEWTGCDSEPGGNCKVKMDEPKSVTAEFGPMPPPPVVTTDPEGTVTQTTAVLNGHVDNEGASLGSACSFQVTLATDPTYASATTVPCTTTPVTGTSNTAVTATATSLTANTAYIYRVRATNAGGGPVNGSSEPFTTLPNAPVVTTDPEGTVTQTTAVLNGHVDNEGASLGSACSFQVTLATDPTYASATTVPCTTTPVTGTSNTAVTATATSLTANTAYIYRVRATNAGGGPANGSSEPFTTLPNAPVVTTDPEGTVTQTTAVLNGHVDNEGASLGSACSFQVTLATDPTYASATTVPCTTTPVTGTSNTAVTATATSLTANTPYIYRVRATNAGGGPVNGSSEPFTTLPNAPVVTTDPEGTVTQTTAVLNGHVDNEGASLGSACSFQVTLATDPTYASATTVPCTTTPVTGTSNTAVTATATSLTANTPYIYRVRATNAGGGPVNGSSEPFTTLPIAPVVTTDPEGTVTQTTAVLNGHVDNEGASLGSACSFQVTLATDPTYASATTVPCATTPVTGTSNTAVTATATSLTANTAYIYRVRATNAGGGPVNGSSEPFTTLPITHTLTVNKTGSGSGSVTCNGTSCASTYANGTKVTLAASAASGSSFAGFSAASGSAASCSSTPCTFTIEADTTVTATFTANPAPTCATDPSLCPPPAEGTAKAAASAPVSGGKAALKLSCSGGACKGTLKLTAKVKQGKKTKNVVIGKASFGLATGASTTLSVKLSGPAKQELAKGKTVKAKLSGTGITASTVKLKPAKPAKKKH